MFIERNNEASSPNLCCHRKAISTKHFECVCILFLAARHSKRVRLITLSSVACPALHNFAHYFIHLTIFGKYLFNIKCVFWFSLQLVSEKFFILKRSEGDTIINIIGVYVKCPLFLADLNETWILTSNSCKLNKERPTWCHLLYYFII